MGTLCLAVSKDLGQASGAVNPQSFIDFCTTEVACSQQLHQITKEPQHYVNNGIISSDLDCWILHVDVCLMRDCTGTKGSWFEFRSSQLFHKGKDHLNSRIPMDLPFGGHQGSKAGEETQQKFPHQCLECSNASSPGCSFPKTIVLIINNWLRNIAKDFK